MHAGKPLPGNLVPPDVQPSPPAPLQTAAEPSAIQKFIRPPEDELPDDLSMPIWDHLEELRERVLISGLAAGLAILTCFCFSKDLVVFLEAPVITQVPLSPSPRDPPAPRPGVLPSAACQQRPPRPLQMQRRGRRVIPVQVLCRASSSSLSRPGSSSSRRSRCRAMPGCWSRRPPSCTR